MPDASSVIQLVTLFILVLLSAFFSSAETAFLTVNRVKMRSLEEDGDKRAARVNKILDNYSKMISTILIGNNIVNIAASALASTLAIHNQIDLDRNRYLNDRYLTVRRDHTENMG